MTTVIAVLMQTHIAPVLILRVAAVGLQVYIAARTVLAVVDALQQAVQLHLHGMVVEVAGRPPLFAIHGERQTYQTIVQYVENVHDVVAKAKNSGQGIILIGISIESYWEVT